MASTIRMAAKLSGDTTLVQALVQHPMDSGFLKDAKGNLIPPHFIEVMEFTHGGNTVFTAFWGTAVAKDPYIKFSFKGGREGDDVTVSWIDNEGQSDSLAGKIQAS
jgi:sulfur-oxidizing protein SoxZ